MVEVEAGRCMRIELTRVGGHQRLDGSILMMGSARIVMVVGMVVVFDGTMTIVDVMVGLQCQWLCRIGSVGRLRRPQTTVRRMT